MTRENINTDQYEDKVTAIAAALEEMGGSGILTICRAGHRSKCPNGEICPVCARVVVTPGLTAFDALAQSCEHQA